MKDAIEALREGCLRDARKMDGGDITGQELKQVASEIDAILAEYADWVAVPKEPTEAMCRCADSNWSGFCADGMDAPRAAARRLYRDMIRAAAKAEEE